MSSGGGGWTGRLLRPPLWCASRVYEQIIRARNRRYDRSPDRAVGAAVPVISVGNLTVGGTGKTPLVIDLATRLVAGGHAPGVLARGYGAGGGEPGDEQLLITRQVPSVVYVADPDRVAGARRAVGAGAADVLILDDGFQHRRLKRDLDIVVIDAALPFGHGHLLPRGLLREPVDGLGRCDLVVMTRCDQVGGDALRAVESQVRVRLEDQPIVRSRHVVRGVRDLATGRERAADVEGADVLLLSAIGQPEALTRSACSIGARACGHLDFDDHHRYRLGDCAVIADRAARGGARAVLTTEKDAVKLERLGFDWPIEVWVLEVALEYLDDGARTIDHALKRLFDGDSVSDGTARV